MSARTFECIWWDVARTFGLKIIGGTRTTLSGSPSYQKFQRTVTRFVHSSHSIMDVKLNPQTTGAGLSLLIRIAINHSGPQQPRRAPWRLHATARSTLRENTSLPRRSTIRGNTPFCHAAPSLVTPTSPTHQKRCQCIIPVKFLLCHVRYGRIRQRSASPRSTCDDTPASVRQQVRHVRIL